jgi:uridine kinase
MDQIASRFLDTIRYRHDELVEPSRWYADVVINGSLASHKGTDILERYILHLLA